MKRTYANPSKRINRVKEAKIRLRKRLRAIYKGIATFAQNQRSRDSGPKPRFDLGPSLKRDSVQSVGLENGTIDEIKLRASICADSFYEFLKEFWEVVVQEPLILNWHMEVLCNEMQELAQRVFRGEIKAHDLVVNISPGSTKSMIMSVMFTAWVWVNMPHARIIGASHTEDLAKDLAFKARDVVMSDKYKKYFPHVELRSDANAKTFFHTTKGGWRFAVGVNGSVIGKHAHFIIIDDPLDPEQSYSPAEIATCNRWIKETLSTRKVNKAITPTCLVMQRLHEDDATAMFLKRKRIRWICFPAELTDDVRPVEYRDKYIDGLMDPVRLGKAVLEEAREEGEYFYGAQFLQTPVPKDGGMFKTDRVKALVPPTRFMKVVRYWDKAGTQGGGAFTVGTKIGKDLTGRFWVLDVRRVQLDSFEREKLIKEIAHSDGHDVEVIVEQEPGSGGKESAEATARNLPGYVVRLDKVSASTGGKVNRADPWSTQMNAGNVYVPEGVDWLAIWKNEHKFFPNSKYKDQVDSASGAFAYVHRRKRKARVLGQKDVIT